MLLTYSLLLLFMICFCCEIKINEILSNMVRFDITQDADFVELAAVGCKTAPDLSSFILLTIQLDFKGIDTPIVLQFVSLNGKTMQSGTLKTDFVKYYSIGNSIPDITSNAFSQTSADSSYNWATKDDFFEINAFSRTYRTGGPPKEIQITRNFAVLLLNTTKSNLKKDNVDFFVEQLQFILSDNRGEKAMIYLNNDGLNEFIFDTTADCIIFAPDQEKLGDNSFGVKLGTLKNKPLLNYDIRAQKSKSVNVCGYELIEAHFTPNDDNICDGIVIYTQDRCIFKSVSARLKTLQRPDYAKTTASCSLDVKSFEELSKREETRYGTVNLADFIFTRGAAKFFDFQNNDVLATISEVYACENHIRELTEDWHKEKKLNIKGTYYCALGPYFDTNKHQTKVKADRFINRAESFLLLINKGVFIPIGTPLCPTHEKLVSSLKNDASDKVETASTTTTTTTTTSPSIGPRTVSKCYSGMDESLDTLTSRYAKEGICLNEADQEKLKSLLRDLKLSPIEMEKPFDEIDITNQRRHTKMLGNVISAVANLKTQSKKSADLLIQKTCEKIGGNNLDKGKTDQMEINIKGLVKFYLKANSRTESYQYLSILAVMYPNLLLQQYIPNLSDFEYTEAKKIGTRKLADQKPLELHRKTYLRNSPLEAIKNFVSFLASSIVTTVLPYGENTIKMSDGRTLELPNAFCDFGPIDTITFYKSEKTRRGEPVQLSDSTMYRVYKTCVTRQRVSLQGVDTFKAAAVAAFRKLSNVVLNDLKKFDLITPEEHDEFEKMLLEAEFFLKTDFFSKLQMEHKSPYLCMRFALSDPADKSFHSNTCTSPDDHDMGCKECDSYRNIIEEMRKIIINGQQREIGTVAQNSLLFHTETLKEAIYKIDDWRSHIVRGRFAYEMKADIIENLDENSCLLTADYSQKWLPRAANEDSSSYYSKAGLSLHVINCLCNISGIFHIHTFGHLMGYSDQDSDIVSGILVNSLKKLKQKGIKKVVLKSDNAGYYKSNILIKILPSVSRKSGVEVIRYTYSEAQLGKDFADSDTSRIKAVLYACLDNQKNVQSAKEMYECLKSAIEKTKLTGFTIVHVTNNGRRSNYKEVPKLTGVTNVGDIEYTMTDNGAMLRYWRHYRIGNGKQITVDKDKVIVQDFAEEESFSSSESTFWRRKIDLSDSTGEHPNESTTPPSEQTETRAQSHDETAEPQETVTDRGTFKCPVDGCIKDFIRRSNLEKHILIGKHTFAPRRETLQDIAAQMYLAELEGVREGFSFFRNNLFDFEYARETLNINAPSKGWALKKRAARASYTNEMIAFLENKYLNARHRGQRRIDAIETSEEMSTAAHPETGKPLFTAEQRLSASQIASWINQKLKKLEKRVQDRLYSPEEERAENILIFDEIAENPGHIEDEATDHPDFADLAETVMEEIIQERNQELFM